MDQNVTTINRTDFMKNMDGPSRAEGMVYTDNSNNGNIENEIS